MRFDVTMHDAFRVAEVESFEHLVNVVANVKVRESFVQRAEIHVTRVHELHDQSRRLRHGITHHIQQVNYVDTVSQRLQNFNFSSDFGLFNYKVCVRLGAIDINQRRVPGLRILITIRSLLAVLIPS